MASSDTAMRSVSEGVNIDCRLAPFSVIGAVDRATSSGRPNASSSRLCSDLKVSQESSIKGSPFLDFVQSRFY